MAEGISTPAHDDLIPEEVNTRMLKKRSLWSVGVGALVLMTMLFAACGPSGGGTSGGTTPPPPPGKIQHVVVIFQENRTPDNLFQDQVLISRGADIAQSAVNSLGQTIPLSPISLGTDGSNPQNYDLDHSHTAFVSMYDGGKMDGANLVGCSPDANCPPNAHPNPQFMYVNPSDVQPYFALAEQYTFADRMFQTNQGPSFPAHQFIISGTSAPCSQALPCPGAGSNLFAAENPKTSDPPDAGCDAPVGSTVLLIDPTGSETSNAPIYPCFEHKTLTDLLEAKGNTWRYYAPGISPPTPPIHSAPAIWNGPEAIQHICGPNATPPQRHRLRGSGLDQQCGP